jgi:hypothetical protein
MVGTIAGILMAGFLNNGGGAWDNAKKYIETGVYGGKRSDAHKAAVVGDTVGDPFKDTAGPSLHVLIKLLSTITLVLAPLFILSVTATGAAAAAPVASFLGGQCPPSRTISLDKCLDSSPASRSPRCSPRARTPTGSGAR